MWPRWIPSINRIEGFSTEPLTAGSQLSVTTRASRFTVTFLMAIAEFAPEESVIMQWTSLATKLTRFDRLEHASGLTMAAAGGNIPGALGRLARQYGKDLSEEIALAVETGIEGSE